MMEKSLIKEHYPPPLCLNEILQRTSQYLTEISWKNKYKILYMGFRGSYGQPYATNSTPMNKPRTHDNHILKHYPGWRGRLWVGANGFIEQVTYNPPSFSPFLGDTFRDLNLHVDSTSNQPVPTWVEQKMKKEYCPQAFHPKIIRHPDGRFAKQTCLTLKTWAWDVTIWEDDWQELTMVNLIDSLPEFRTDKKFETWYFNLREPQVISGFYQTLAQVPIDPTTPPACVVHRY